ncbi:hypothetical protein HYR54_05680 [Candidatus Acetothermia bacterium]|nr:hypothetical protein [Candidatus Acetothermia bacterium]
MNAFELKYSELISEFDKYILEHPEFAKKLPYGAHVVLQIEEDEALNEWAREVAEKNAEADHPLVYIKIKKLKPARSRIAKLELAKVA